MSGCAICIYDLYMDAKQSYRQSLLAALSQLEHKRVDEALWPEEIVALSRKRKASSKANAGNPVEQDDGEEDMDPTMKAFLELERRLKG